MSVNQLSKKREIYILLTNSSDPTHRPTLDSELFFIIVEYISFGNLGISHPCLIVNE